MRAIVFTGAGGAEVMELTERQDPVPGSDEVLVAATHSGINPADVSQRAGNYPPPPGAPADVPGLEVCGTVVACGENVSEWREGDRVFGLVGGGGLADRVRVHARHVARVPERLTEEQAAAAPEAFITAHDAAFTQGGLRPGERLLVNGANGGVGLAGVQMGVATGARVLATVRSDAVRERLEGMGAELVALDEVRGVDVVLELVGGPNIPADLQALASQGRIVVVSSAAGESVELPIRLLMGRRATMRGTLLRARPIEQKAAAVQAFAREVVPLLESGAVEAVVDSVFPAERAAEAFDHIQQPGKFGKVLLAW
jgi:NADPH:quinone reductase-like Zn-dependent oxidoreductase